MEYITPTEGYPSGMSNAASSWPPASTAIDFPAFQAMLDSDPTLRSGPGSITWQVNGELAIVAGWGYAVLMQVAHPMIAEGVARHSTFSHSPAAKLKRFMRTLEQMLRLTFGTSHEVWQAAQRIDRIHDYVHGQMDHSHANTARYSAHDPELLKWVHSTFVHAVLRTYSMLVRPLTLAEKDDYLHKASIVGPLLGMPFGYVSNTWRGLDTYIQATVNSNTLKVGAQAQSLADYVLERFPLPVLGHSVEWYIRLVTAALLPPSLRDAYGLKWTSLDPLALSHLSWHSRQWHRFLPAPLHRWPLATRARRSSSRKV
jgi:uncharacterized protein (DUF2236 family)